MTRLTRRAGLAAALLTVLALVAGLLPPRADALASLPDLKARAIYFLKAGDEVQRDLAVTSLTSTSTFEGKLWGQFLGTWASINNRMTMNKTVPAGLPAKGHVFVVLGSALTSSGGLTAKLERRLKLALAALQAYPNSDVLVSGGAPRNGRTEAQVMRTWLIDHGVASSRIVIETRSSSTVGNARYSIGLLRSFPEYTSYTLISDSSHLRRATILFNAATVRVQVTDGRAWGIRSLANVAYPDLATAGQGPLRASSVANTAAEVASLFGLTSQYRALLAAPPESAVLTSVSLTPPTKRTFRVGDQFSRTGLKVTAFYAQGLYSQVVTDSVRISGFTTATTGHRTATVSFTAGGVTKTATFGYTVVKAAAAAKLTVSSTRPVAYRTRIKATVVVTAGAPVPTGAVRFYLDGKLRATVKLTAAHQGRASFTYPLLAYLGKRQLTVRYAGNARLTSAAATVTVTVRR